MRSLRCRDGGGHRLRVLGGVGTRAWGRFGARCGARRGGQRHGETAEFHVHDEHRFGGSGRRGRPQGLREFRVPGRSLADRRDRRHDHRVARLVGQRPGQRRVEVLGRGLGRQVQRRQRTQPLRETGVVRQQAQRLGVAEDRHPRARRQRLTGEQQARVDQFGDGVHTDHAGLPQQRRHRRVGQPGRPYGVPLRGGTGALDDHQGLGRRRAPREAGELARVADGFQVHEGDVGVGVVVPVLEDVVARDVRAVAGGDEGGYAGDAGDAAATPVEAGQQGDADGAGLGEQADPAGSRHLRGQRGVQPHLGGGVDDSEGIGADDPHAVRACVPDEFALALPPVGAALGVGRRRGPRVPARRARRTR